MRDRHLSQGKIAFPLRELLERLHNLEFVLAEVTGIDAEHGRVLARRPLGEQLEFGYDYLILAAGVRQSYFGHDEYAAFAPGMKTLEDALKIRRRIYGAFEMAESADDPAETPALAPPSPWWERDRAGAQDLLRRAGPGGRHQDAAQGVPAYQARRRPGPAVRRRQGPAGNVRPEAVRPGRVVSTKRLHFGGFLGWVAWLFIHIGFLTGWRNRVGALFGWWFAFARDLRRERGFTIDDMPIHAYSEQADTAAGGGRHAIRPVNT